MHLPLTIGTRPDGSALAIDLAAMPHLLVAGTTGSGKSVFLNHLLLQLMALGPDRVRFVLVDPKRVEFMPFRDVAPVYVSDGDALACAAFLAEEMERRFHLLERFRARDITDLPADDRMPRYVCVVDELAALMLGSMGPAIGSALTKVAQMARAAGIHLVLATQRPTVDVVTGLLKANIPARVSFLVNSRVDSQVIIDEPGAEGLRGKGDMLVRIPGQRGLARAQGEYISLDTVEAAVGRYTEVSA